MWTRTEAVVAASLLAAATGPAVSDEVDDRLRRAFDETGYVYSRLDDGSYVVVFDAVHARERSNWPVTVRSVAAGEWILVTAILVDREPGHRYSLETLQRAMVRNGRTVGASITLDIENGDLDVQDEIPVEALDGAVLARTLGDVAATCDTYFAEFDE
jgi:hypothetical protein